MYSVLSWLLPRLWQEALFAQWIVPYSDKIILSRGCSFSIGEWRRYKQCLLKAEIITGERKWRLTLIFPSLLVLLLLHSALYGTLPNCMPHDFTFLKKRGPELLTEQVCTNLLQLIDSKLCFTYSPSKAAVCWWNIPPPRPGILIQKLEPSETSQNLDCLCTAWAQKSSEIHPLHRIDEGTV